MNLYRNWQCRACGERGSEATDDAPFLASGFTCLADEPWFARDYPEGMKHHWSDGTPLSIVDGKFWWAVGSRGAADKLGEAMG